jgi:uncharacterized protein (TIGR03437 family)
LDNRTMSSRWILRFVCLVCACLGALFGQNAPEFKETVVDGQIINYQVQAGYAIVQGDMIIGTAAEFEAQNRTVREGREGLSPKSLHAIFTRSIPSLWTNGTMYYAIDPAIPNPQRILDAIDYWNTKTHLTIVPRTDQPNYVQFSNIVIDAACNSNIGMIGGKQTIGITDSCSAGSLIHELGHSWGLLHEHQRSDRNAYITVLYSNIDKRFYSDFNQSIATAQDTGYYDYESIMHYPPTGFTVNGTDSIETVPVGIPIGQRSVLSAGDIDGVERLYGLVPTATTITTTPAGLPIIVDGNTVVAPQSFDWAPGSRHTIEVAQAQGTDPRYSFARWTDGGDAAHTFTASPDRTVVCAAFVRAHPFRISAVGGGEAAVAPEPADGYFVERSPVLINETPGSGQFLRWSGFGLFSDSGYGFSSPSIPLDAPDARGTFQAAFTTGTFYTVDSQQRGRIVVVDGLSTLTPTRYAWIPGSSHSLAVPASELDGNNTARYQFLNWEDGTTGLSRIVTAGDAATWTAAFDPQFLLTLSPLGPGTIAASPDSPDGFYDTTAIVRLTAQPSGVTPLRYWLGDLTGGAGTGTVTMDRQRSVTAYFAAGISFRVLGAADFAGGPVLGDTGTLVAPGELIAIFGSGIGPGTPVFGAVGPDGKLSTSAGGSTVLFGNVAAPIVFASKDQINAIVPFGAASQPLAAVQIRNAGRQGLNSSISIGATAPGLFTSNGSGVGQAAALNQDGSVNSPDNPAAAGSVMVLYGTGAGATLENSSDGEIIGATLYHPKAAVYVRVGKLPADVLYAGSAPQLVNGVLQVNVRLPAGLVGGGAVPVQLVVGSYSSVPGVTISVK